jgi:plastocyanin
MRTTPFLALFMTISIVATAWGYEVRPVKNGGEVRGRVKLGGPVPKDETIVVTKDQQRCGKTLKREKYVINADGGVKNAVVLIEGINAGKPVPKGVMVIDNKKCAFDPHVQVGMVGQDLVLRNDDPILHNTHLYHDNMTIFNANLPRQGMEFERTVFRPGVITLTCDAHPWMKGYLYMSEHPYVAVTDAQGDFSIADLPPGAYTLKIWHEALGEQTKKITVAPSGSSMVAVEFTK